MYSENVEIKVNGRIITIAVPCSPNTPKAELKKKAVDIYLQDLKNRLYERNGIS